MSCPSVAPAAIGATRGRSRPGTARPAPATALPERRRSIKRPGPFHRVGRRARPDEAWEAAMTEPERRPVRLRIAPSPTGDPHVGTAYLALFDMAYAHRHGGQFVLRIEDTDQNRLRRDVGAATSSTRCAGSA